MSQNISLGYKKSCNKITIECNQRPKKENNKVTFCHNGSFVVGYHQGAIFYKYKQVV